MWVLTGTSSPASQPEGRCHRRRCACSGAPAPGHLRSGTTGPHTAFQQAEGRMSKKTCTPHHDILRQLTCATSCSPQDMPF